MSKIRRIWQNLYDKAIDDGCTDEEALKLANERSDEIYWELVDLGRQRAKDGEL